ncbi:DUF4760 domain-containing protein [Dinghuibacter silviterrae]|uniref:Uncharacterized protein DUF4760 n=1 Tax=Dinghuibacter silviterrae TaxID=1539049 RepID=A0A4R8DRY9_9BACT|nr:DUF4760 domain-containing protein [Dinghuibacter silviterrae]TDX01002.1 uncharacterized protein DUF4760 [Dinghuibacter silviterrae]
MIKGEQKYSIGVLDGFINNCISFVFYYRLIFVFLALLAVCFYGVHEYNVSGKEDALKNLCFVLTAGSIVIGIFYSILNYEKNHQKIKNDEDISKLTNAFNAAFEWTKPTMVENLKITKKMHNEHKHLCDQNKSKEFFDILEKNEEARSALVSILNYLELLAIGIEEEVLDEKMIKRYFKSMFFRYHANYEFYIKYRRKVHHSPTSWEYFTNLAEKWNREN